MISEMPSGLKSFSLSLRRLLSKITWRISSEPVRSKKKHKMLIFTIWIYVCIYLFILSFHKHLLSIFSVGDTWYHPQASQHLVAFRSLLQLELYVIPCFDLASSPQWMCLLLQWSNWKHNLDVYCEKRLYWMLWYSQSPINMQIIGQWNYWVNLVSTFKR